jgi:hypothetical protein
VKEGDITFLLETEQEQYPFAREDFPQDTRKTAHIQAPALFGMIKKSLALRIHHDGLRY